MPRLVIAGVSILACLYDVRYRRIPNWLTLGAAGMAFAYFLATGGWREAGLGLAGWAIAAALFFPFFALGGMGAGDVKLVAALGAWFGPHDAFWLVLYSALAGGVAAILVAVWHGYVRSLFDNLWLLLMHWRVFGVRRVEEMTLETGQGPRLAYALPIAVGALVTAWLSSGVPH